MGYKKMYKSFQLCLPLQKQSAVSVYFGWPDGWLPCPLHQPDRRGSFCDAGVEV